MKKNSFLDFVIKNRYIIVCVSIVLVIAALGLIPKLVEIAVTVGLIMLAIYIGKRIQEDQSFITRAIEKQTKKVDKQDKE